MTECQSPIANKPNSHQSHLVLFLVHITFLQIPPDFNRKSLEGDLNQKCLGGGGDSKRKSLGGDSNRKSLGEILTRFFFVLRGKYT